MQPLVNKIGSPQCRDLKISVVQDHQRWKNKVTGKAGISEHTDVCFWVLGPVASWLAQPQRAPRGRSACSRLGFVAAEV